MAEFGQQIAMHAAGMRPLYLARQHVPKEALNREAAVLRQQVRGASKADVFMCVFAGLHNVFGWVCACVLTVHVLVCCVLFWRAWATRSGVGGLMGASCEAGRGP